VRAKTFAAAAVIALASGCAGGASATGPATPISPQVTAPVASPSLSAHDLGIAHWYNDVGRRDFAQLASGVRKTGLASRRGLTALGAACLRLGKVVDNIQSRAPAPDAHITGLMTRGLKLVSHGSSDCFAAVTTGDVGLSRAASAEISHGVTYIGRAKVAS
jgi:hypothetical protein